MDFTKSRYFANGIIYIYIHIYIYTARVKAAAAGHAAGEAGGLSVDGTGLVDLGCAAHLSIDLVAFNRALTNLASRSRLPGAELRGPAGRPVVVGAWGEGVKCHGNSSKRHVFPGCTPYRHF